MPSHVALLVVIISVKSSSLCSSGLAKYKLTKETSQMIQWKYFFPTNEQPQVFSSGDIAFVSEKYVVENFDQCLTVTYVNILDSGNPNHEFDTIDVPICIPHYFKKYLEPTGSNIKLNNTYLISGLVRFLTSGKIMIEATDIDFLKTLKVNYSTYESSSTVPSIRSIFDIIADDVDSVTTQISIKHEEPMNSLVENNITIAKLFKSSADINTGAETSSSYKGKKPYNQPDYIDLDTQSRNAI
ncbi:45380_t:CDS:2, partial [Gigaspora margarita]